jgi:hypothetical protein
VGSTQVTLDPAFMRIVGSKEADVGDGVEGAVVGGIGDNVGVRVGAEVFSVGVGVGNGVGFAVGLGAIGTGLISMADTCA